MRCEHVREIRDVDPDADGCSECLARNDAWVHLRECLVCGHVACCDSSPNRHARKHFRDTGHPIVRSFEPGEEWKWCWVDEAFVDDAGTAAQP